MRIVRSKAMWVLLAAVGVFVLRLVIPPSIEGDWMGTLTLCACNEYSFLRFQDGHAVMYGHGGEPTASVRDFGTYQRIAKNTYRWDTAENPNGPITVRVGWIFSSFKGMQGFGTFYCWRYPLFRKADRIVRESQRMAEEHKKSKANK